MPTVPGNSNLANLAKEIAALAVSTSHVLDASSVSEVQTCLDRQLKMCLLANGPSLEPLDWDSTVGWCVHSALLPTALWPCSFRKLVEHVAEKRAMVTCQLSEAPDLGRWEFLVAILPPVFLGPGQQIWLGFVSTEVVFVHVGPLRTKKVLALDLNARLDLGLIGQGLRIRLDTLPLQAAGALSRVLPIDVLSIILDCCGGELGGCGVRISC